jgi:hypothetical protein
MLLSHKVRQVPNHDRPSGVYVSILLSICYGLASLRFSRSAETTPLEFREVAKYYPQGSDGGAVAEPISIKSGSQIRRQLL